MIPNLDNDGEPERSDEAWRIAREIVAANPSADWPALPRIVGELAQFLTTKQAETLTADVRQAMNEAYFYGLIWASETASTSVDVNGIRTEWPELQRTHPDLHSALLTSFETALSGLEPREAAMLADRFQGLAALCRQVAAQR